MRDRERKEEEEVMYAVGPVCVCVRARVRVEPPKRARAAASAYTGFRIRNRACACARIRSFKLYVVRLRAWPWIATRPLRTRRTKALLLSLTLMRAQFRSSKKKNLPLAREAATLLLIALARISIQPGIERIMTRFTGAIKCTRPRGDARCVRALS